MLPSKERFSRLEFSNFLENKGILVVYNRLGTLKYLPISPTTRFSVITSSKHEKKAVARNKFRRRVYSLVHKAQLPLHGVLYTAKQSYSLTYPEITHLFNELLTKSQKNTK
jgi:ribonuclease P protein component